MASVRPTLSAPSLGAVLVRCGVKPARRRFKPDDKRNDVSRKTDGNLQFFPMFYFFREVDEHIVYLFKGNNPPSSFFRKRC